MWARGGGAGQYTNKQNDPTTTANSELSFYFIREVSSEQPREGLSEKSARSSLFWLVWPRKKVCAATPDVPKSTKGSKFCSAKPEINLDEYNKYVDANPFYWNNNNRVVAEISPNGLLLTQRAENFCTTTRTNDESPMPIKRLRGITFWTELYLLCVTMISQPPTHSANQILQFPSQRKLTPHT